MSLYRLFKLSDKTNKDGMNYDQFKEKRKSDNYPYYYLAKMSGMPAYAHTPSKKALDLLDKIDKGEKLSEEEKDTSHNELWESQEILKPIIGMKVHFLSISMDSGWFRTSAVEKYETKDNGDVVITTANSVYLAELDVNR